MAIAAEDLAAAGAARAASQRGGGFRPAQAAGAYRAVSGPSETAKTITRLAWAVAIGLIVLEVASQATGQFWSFNLQGPGLEKQPYRPLYGAQNPLVFTGTTADPNVHLSGRAGGNLGA